VYDKIMCVGCGRCITLCPVGIDIIKVLDKVKEHGA
jgi:NAD-dependent dihydropyrimidine dehydrogenase PreA subunit